MVLEAFQASLTFKKWVCFVTLSTSDSSQAWKRNRGVMSQEAEPNSLFNSLNPHTHAQTHKHTCAHTYTHTHRRARAHMSKAECSERCCIYCRVGAKVKLVRDQVRFYWLNFCVGQDHDFSCTSMVKQHRAVHRITQDACAHTCCPQAAQFYFRRTMVDRKDKNSISKVWGWDRTRPEELPLIQAGVELCESDTRQAQSLKLNTSRGDLAIGELN